MAKSSSQPQKPESPRTRRALIHLLKQGGAMDSQTLARQLGVSAMAVRQHLYALQAQKLVNYQEEPRAMGRPAKLWQLTAAADRLFPDGYAELTLGLLESVLEAFGQAGLDQLLAVRTRHQIADYQAQLFGSDVSSDVSPSISPSGSPDAQPQPLSQTLAKLAQQRTAEGYMAEVEALADGTFLLIENHCPICAAAAACTGLCDRELEVFQAVLGDRTHISRTEHIIAGARRCVYRIQPLEAAP